MTAPTCRMCAAQDRDTPLTIRAGVAVCPICDQPRPKPAKTAKEKP